MNTLCLHGAEGRRGVDWGWGVEEVQEMEEGVPRVRAANNKKNFKRRVNHKQQ